MLRKKEEGEEEEKEEERRGRRRGGGGGGGGEGGGEGEEERSLSFKLQSLKAVISYHVGLIPPIQHPSTLHPPPFHRTLALLSSFCFFCNNNWR